MIVRLLLAALAAGLIAGLAMTPAQYTKIVPLILEAETYETMPAADEVAGEAGHAHADGHEHGDVVAHRSTVTVEQIARFLRRNLGSDQPALARADQHVRDVELGHGIDVPWRFDLHYHERPRQWPLGV